MPQSTPAFKIHGFSEVVISVRSLDEYEATFHDIGGWHTRSKNPVLPQQLRAWGLPETLTAEEMLMAHPDSDTGFVRFVCFEGLAQTEIRANDQPWDSGGIFDINIRVENMAQVRDKMVDAQWQANTDPVLHHFGPFSVTEWVPRYSDGTRLALIERLAPPLEGWPNLKHFSRVFNSTFIVRDIQRSVHFFRDVLNMQEYIHTPSTELTAGPNVFGLPHNLSDTISHEIYILHPEKLNEGSVELIQLNGVTGRDLSANAHLPNLGVAMLRFPVENVEYLYQHLLDHQIPIVSKLQTLEVSPYGTTKRFIVSAPEGGWLEFFEN